MALATLNGIPIVEARIAMPRVGIWSAEVVLDTPDDPPTGRVTIAIDGGLTLQGTVQRGGSWLQTGYVLVLAGAGGLRTVAQPRAYTSTIVGSVLKDLLAAAGETLSPTADQGVLLTQLVSGWNTAAETVGQCIGSLIGAGAPVGSTWRALSDGTHFVGPETWPDSGMQAGTDFQDISENPIEASMEIGIEAPSLLPGTLIDGRKVDFVEHVIASSKTRSRIMFVRKRVDGTDAA